MKEGAVRSRHGINTLAKKVSSESLVQVQRSEYLREKPAG